jgi:hypothetical protein
MSDLKVRFSGPDMAALEAEARGKKVALAEVVRQAVAEHPGGQTAARAAPFIDACLGKHLDRLAGLIAKTFIAADMANWQSRALVAALVEDQEPEAVMREARTRALSDLRRSGTEIGTDGDLYAPEG